MATQIFVNLPVKDLKRSMSFYDALGFKNNPQFTDENAACMVVSDTIYVMLLVEPYFTTFSPRPISDATKATEVLIALSCDSRGEVDEMVNTALANGGTRAMDPQDHGFMYAWSFYDIDGHHWEVLWMDPAAVK